MTPSRYQQTFLDAIQNSRKYPQNYIVDAIAGSGKSTSIKMAVQSITWTNSILILAFNKKIAEEMASKISNKNVQVSTFHSCGFKAWAKYVGKRVSVAKNKTWMLIEEHLSAEEAATYGPFINRMVGYAKSCGLGGDYLKDVKSSWEEIREHFDVDIIPSREPGDESDEPDLDTAYQLCSKIYRKSAALKHVIDFDDMLFLPYIYKVPFFKFKYIFIDELQDTNVPQCHLLKSMMFDDSTLVGVGDPYQSIYGFRGASSEAMNFFREFFNTRSLPLSICYRCSKAVIRLAQTIVPHIEASDNAPEGSVQTLKDYKADIFKPADAILCRNTAPLVSLAYKFIAKRIGVQVLGRDIGIGLINLIKKLAGKTIKDIDTFEVKLSEWADREIAKAEAKHDDSMAEAINNKADCIRIFIENLSEDSRSITHLIDEINDLFVADSYNSDDNRAKVKKKDVLTLCSIHKSKGLEWDNVYILDAWRMPSKYAKQDWQKEQETNLQYVAYTRAKINLAFIELNKFTA